MIPNKQKESIPLFFLLSKEFVYKANYLFLEGLTEIIKPPGPNFKINFFELLIQFH